MQVVGLLERLRERRPRLLDALVGDGIVVSEIKARMSPCTCYRLPSGEDLCFSKGIIGALSDDQERLYCNPKTYRESHNGLPMRVMKFKSAAKYCKGRPIGEFLKCMKKRLGG